LPVSRTRKEERRSPGEEKSPGLRAFWEIKQLARGKKGCLDGRPEREGKERHVKGADLLLDFRIHRGGKEGNVGGVPTPTRWKGWVMRGKTRRGKRKVVAAEPKKRTEMLRGKNGGR